MKKKSASQYFFIELVLAAAIASLFSYFSQSFYFWFIIALVCLLIFHHYNEAKLLKMLTAEDNTALKKTHLLDNISQTTAYYKSKNRKEKIKTLRLLSKLNKNMQYLPDAILICDNDGNISWCNNASQEMFLFYWNKKVPHKNIFNVIFYQEFKHYFYQTLRKRPLVLLTNENRYLEIHIQHYDHQSCVIIARDVTQMIRLLHSRQTFLSNINHELRTPLTVLQGYLELLEGEPNQSHLAQKAIKAMQEQSQRMANLLKQLNLLAKIQNASNIERTSVNMSALILNLQENATFLNHYHHNIHFYITPDIYVLGDESQLQSAVSNLIYNAIKHAGQGCEIDIHWQYCEEGARFSVKDNGIGIAAQHLHHLTERFYRVDESRSNQTGGTGLGLAIVKHALEHHHSKLHIESKEGEGSCFSFVIPQKYLHHPKKTPH
ncbi:phosphate regulon sensor histidine kinase PhoR [Pasteurella sp. PK-2025]|uniref:phosphate regulon sensor histidine kinase PhoR n=1 Tax=Pasteurella sp. PK-2025 TaxID=3413133 RepID=UPI003C719AF6